MGRLSAGIDVSTPNVARMYDYYLGGKNNFQADRIAAEKVLALIPGLRRACQENRRFLRRVVRFLGADVGISQFIDIGVGLPTQGAVHEVAEEASPHARVLYADNDPVVVAHGQALLSVADRSIMVHGDLRKPAELLDTPDVNAHIDLRRPVAILLIAMLHFVPDEDDPAGVMACLRDRVAPGSYLAITHVSSDFFPDKVALDQAVAVYEQASQRIWPRPRAEIARYLDGFELIEPGMVPTHEWRPVTGISARRTPNIQWSAVARKR